ncbi:cytochrome c [Ectothiorhodospiraceae bacterium 2226]|nr:cytochrome c [Ectothiorhodospiraceae bacterium 2226]
MAGRGVRGLARNRSARTRARGNRETTLSKTLIWGAVVAGALLLAGCGQSEETASAPPAASGANQAQHAQQEAEFVPDLARGQSLFENNCVVCHGVRGSGTDQGPPLVHKVYEPSHHSDLAFFIAMRDGVRAHHWEFGDMPPVEGLEVEDMAQIIVYIRTLQREAGIF